MTSVSRSVFIERSVSDSFEVVRNSDTTSSCGVMNLCGFLEVMNSGGFSLAGNVEFDDDDFLESGCLAVGLGSGIYLFGVN